MLKINYQVILIIVSFLLFMNLIVQGKPNEKELATYKEELDKKINVKIDQEPLEEFFVQLRKTCKLPIIASSKVNIQKIIQISFADTSVKDVIYWVCQKYHLDYEIKRGALYFLDLDESLKKNVIFKAYDIQFLQKKPLENYFELASPIEGLFDERNASITVPAEADEGDPFLYIGNAIGQIIENKIPEGNWNSPETLIEVKGNSLRVKNIPEVQDKVETILKHYHEKFGVQIHSEVTILTVPKKEYNEYIINELNGSNILTAKELKEFLSKKRLLWQNQKIIFSATTVSYNSCLTKVSILNRKDTLSEIHVCDAEYDAAISGIYNDDGVSIAPLINKDQSEIILTINGQYSPILEVLTPKLDIQNQMNSIDKNQVEVAQFTTSAQIKNGGGVLISIGSNALTEMGEQLIIFCITSKIYKK